MGEALLKKSYWLRETGETDSSSAFHIKSKGFNSQMLIRKQAGKCVSETITLTHVVCSGVTVSEGDRVNFSHVIHVSSRLFTIR